MIGSSSAAAAAARGRGSIAAEETDAAIDAARSMFAVL